MRETVTCPTHEDCTLTRETKDDQLVWESHAPSPIPVEQTNRAEIESKAKEALAANKTFLAIASPSAAQNAAQIKSLTRQATGIIRLLLNRFEDAE